jgi:large subunit ribosomal protein L1
MKRRSRRYKEAQDKLDKTKTYGLKEAISVLKQFPRAKFDETVEISVSLNIDPKKSEQLVRGTVVLPHGTGKNIRVAVFCKGEHESLARNAGADIVGSEDLIEKVSKGFLDFDCAIATPEMMRNLSKLGKVLGPRGLMPSPKTGTVTNNIEQAIKEVKAGKIEFKSDKQGDIHAGIGKISFSEDQLYDNAMSLAQAIASARPASVKGEFIKAASIASSMNPGIRISL